MIKKKIHKASLAGSCVTWYNPKRPAPFPFPISEITGLSICLFLYHHVQCNEISCLHWKDKGLCRCPLNISLFETCAGSRNAWVRMALLVGVVLPTLLCLILHWQSQQSQFTVAVAFFFVLMSFVCLSLSTGCDSLVKKPDISEVLWVMYQGLVKKRVSYV